MTLIEAEHPALALERAVGEPAPSTQYPEAGTKISGTPDVMRSGQVHATEILKVSTRSRPSAVAGAIAGVMREQGEVNVQAIGAGATNQAIKAIAIARSYLHDDGMDVGCVPFFIDVMIDGEERTAMSMVVQQRHTSGTARINTHHEPR
jgi:stage V sporulation protein S